MKTLTNFSLGNLAVIQNFILHLTHCSDESDNDWNKSENYTPEELYAIAYEYILEDHSDGENSEEAQIEIKLAKKLKKIKIGVNVKVPDPIDGDIHNHSFVGYVKGFRNDNAVVEDGDGDCFEIEPIRLKIVK